MFLQTPPPSLVLVSRPIQTRRLRLQSLFRLFPFLYSDAVSVSFLCWFAICEDVHRSFAAAAEVEEEVAVDGCGVEAKEEVLNPLCQRCEDFHRHEGRCPRHRDGPRCVFVSVCTRTSFCYVWRHPYRLGFGREPPRQDWVVASFWLGALVWWQWVCGTVVVGSSSGLADVVASFDEPFFSVVMFGGLLFSVMPSLVWSYLSCLRHLSNGDAKPNVPDGSLKNDM